jgi:hypothetical protein
MSSDQDSEKVPKRVEEGAVVKNRPITSAAFVELRIRIISFLNSVDYKSMQLCSIG